MNKFVLGFLIFFSIMGWNKYGSRFLSSNKLPYFREPSSLASDTCYQKKMCAVIYIAPWCPACEQITPFIQSFIKNVNNNDNGLLVIIGAGSADENQKKLEAFTSNAVIDKDLSLSKSLGVSYYPTFYVIDNSRKITMRDQEAFNWIQKNFAQ